MTERTTRSLPAVLGWLALAALVAMSLFHLYTGTFGARPAMVQRSTHLAFALGLAFVLFPLFKRHDWRWLLLLDLPLALLGVLAAGYVGYNHAELAGRAGAPTMLDLFAAGVGVVLVLEATRRSVSPALFFITVAFLAYGLLGQFIPGEAGHTGLTIRQVLNFQFYTSEGVFGVPLAVSATFVFLFVLFGAVLERSGAGQYLIDLAFAVMGRYRGGPAKAAVVASGLMGTVSGSSIANTVTTGTLTVPMMKKAGFKPHVAGAVEVAASTNGQLMPPVMGAAAFIMAEFTQIPYGTIVIAALLPALLSYTVIFTMIHLEALRTGIKAGLKETLPAFWRTVLRGLHLNIPFFALLFFLLVLWYTPTTAATHTIWITFALFLLVCLVAPPTAYGIRTQTEEEQLTTGAGSPRRDGVGFAWRIKHFALRSTQALRDGAMNMVGIACACACCGIIIGVVNQTGLASKLTEIIRTLSNEALLPALVITAFACIVLGIGLPTTATYIIMATLTAPAILEIAALNGYVETTALILATHLFVFYYGILADDTPPVGLCAYAIAGIAQADPIRTGLTSFRFDLAAFLLPFIFWFNTELLLQDVTVVQVMWVLPGALLGMICFAMALQGYAWGRLAWWARGLLIVVAFLLVKPALWATGLGGALLALLFGLGYFFPRAAQPTSVGGR
ncbi:MAG: TRAP transporter permease [Phycisphaeraceae bacterium]